MTDTDDPTKPLDNAEKFKPTNVRGDTKNAASARDGKAPDTPRGSEHHLQRKSMHRER